LAVEEDEDDFEGRALSSAGRWSCTSIASLSLRELAAVDALDEDGAAADLAAGVAADEATNPAPVAMAFSATS
jgi:hypothetical protein